MIIYSVKVYMQMGSELMHYSTRTIKNIRAKTGAKSVEFFFLFLTSKSFYGL